MLARRLSFLLAGWLGGSLGVGTRLGLGSTAVTVKYRKYLDKADIDVFRKEHGIATAAK